MNYRNQKNNVIYRNRKAILMGYFDTLCLLFDMKDGKPNVGDIKVIENYPKGYYCVFFMQLPIEERKQIRIDYEILDDHADPSEYATVKCRSCGKTYKVNRNPGYRTSFFKWTLM